MLVHRFLSMLWGAAACIAADAAPPTFKIDSLYSNLDGSIQFIRLTETEGLNGQNRLKGLKLTSTHNGVTKEYTFANDIPTEYTAHVSIVVVAAPVRGVPFLRAPGQWSCCWDPYYEMPERFLTVGGGRVDYAGVDQMVYEKLPTTGSHALHRDGTIGAALLPSGPCQTFPCKTGTQVANTPVQVIEYFNQTLNHYFVSASADEIDMLDTGRIPGWQRTHFGFAAQASPVLDFAPSVPAVAQPVCRFYIPPALGDSHFLSASPEECVEVSERFPMLVLESRAAFHAVVPNRATGACPPNYYDGNDEFVLSWVPVFRFWNDRADTNHRYTSKPEDRSEMIALGWVPEGYGPAGVAFCAPQFQF